MKCVNCGKDNGTPYDTFYNGENYCAKCIHKAMHGLKQSITTIYYPKIDGNISDGYHTFNELYHHRAVLFAMICNQNTTIAWKSKKHSDGTMFENMFIVGIETPQGQATYHYDINPYWDYFKVKELSNAPIWDGHMASQAINRILQMSKIVTHYRPESEVKAETAREFAEKVKKYFIAASKYSNLLDRDVSKFNPIIDRIAAEFSVNMEDTK